MGRNLISYGLQYGCILVEAALVLYVVTTSKFKKRGGVAFYLSSLLVAELARAFTLEKYGLFSSRYFHVYWITDFLLVSSAFILVCLFFRRACQDREKMWHSVRLLLPLIPPLVVGISGLIFSRNYKALFPYFIYEFNQNLYFTCLVLNTLLYILLQHLESTDDELGLLVCGVGIQFAGPTATLALVHLTTAERYAQWLNSITIPLCTFGMLLVWAYAIMGVRKKAVQPKRSGVPVLAEATADWSA